ncbi:LysR family transcriptional regulator [Modicisalibacter tunisiensis]|uniref:LysR family transcriptional regulator n=1 Tax=Modicisalibacter tunisiensis TaxID=390637 RepID=A0ABS7WW90_9GAMM|nr:LysR family transcriptional regulator [Modicisalibacter tunisiensis]MBZ9566866.1 LysR family transcriptional regulator [Modicisalibacter tunisiensis]
MDHRQLTFLVALARERHFGRAAEACHVTQPTLSARLQQLEEELGTPLIRRSRRFEGLTPEGQRVLAHAHRILDEFDALRADVGPDTAPSGCLSLGVIPTALYALDVRLPALRRAFPRLRLHVRELATLALAQGLEDGSLDLVLGYTDAPAMAGYAHRELYREHPALIASPAYFSLPEVPHWQALGQWPLCLLTPEMEHRKRLETRLAEHGIAVAPVVEANSIATLEAMLQAGVGASVLPAHFAERATGQAPLTARRLPGDGDRVGLLWHATRAPSRRLQAALSLWQADAETR